LFLKSLKYISGIYNIINRFKPESAFSTANNFFKDYRCRVKPALILLMPNTLGKLMKDKDKHNIIEYRIAGDWVVMAGKTDDDNDYLSIRLAHPNDYWFHVRGMPAPM
jgi:hypothetical protein